MEIDSPNATGIISGFGVPTGGTSGQVLQKVNATNYNTQWVNADTPTYIQAAAGTAQSIPNATQTIVANWVNSFAQNASEWNPTTGIFTATKAGWYSVSGTITFGNVIDNVNTEYSVAVNKNGTVIANDRLFVQLTQTASNPSFKQIPIITAIVQVAVGDTITLTATCFAGAARVLHTNGNFITIQELPTKILK